MNNMNNNVLYKKYKNVCGNCIYYRNNERCRNMNKFDDHVTPLDDACKHFCQRLKGGKLE